MALTITFFSCRLFLYCSYDMWRLMHSVELSFLKVADQVSNKIDLMEFWHKHLAKQIDKKGFPLSLDFKEHEQALLVCHGGTYWAERQKNVEFVHNLVNTVL